jgi:acetyl-CoA carboxylase carboxyl transferase subunit beta
MLKDLFRTKPKYITVQSKVRYTLEKEVSDGLWTKCSKCNQLIYNKEIAKNLYVCPKCGYHFRIGAMERLGQLVDEGSFKELDADLFSCNPLGFEGYEEKLESAKSKVGMNEAVILGEASIEGYDIIIAVTDFNFIGGSMGSVVGEKITRAAERALELQRPFVSVSSGGGGARMYEGTLSLMQMAKTSAAISRLDEAGILYISVLCDPTMGGVFASYASLGHINIAEPEALIGFAGPRVIEQTKEKLPPGFQRSEFLLKHGMIDMIVERKDLRNTLGRLLKFHAAGGVRESV